MRLELPVYLGPFGGVGCRAPCVYQLIGLRVMRTCPSARRVKQSCERKIRILGDISPSTIESFTGLALAEKHVNPGAQLQKGELQIEAHFIEVLFAS